MKIRKNNFLLYCVASFGIVFISPQFLAAQKLAGMTISGGSSGGGTIFQIDADGKNYADLIDFEVGNQSSKIILGKDGALYGTSNSGGSKGYGVLFKINIDGTNYKILHEFDFNSCAPSTRLLEASDGRFYGIATAFGYRTVLYSLNTDGSDFKILNNSSFDTLKTISDLFEASNGKIFATTDAFFIDNPGSIFSINKDGTGYSQLYSFPSHIGNIQKNTSLIQDANGNLYGGASGGVSSNGIVYTIKSDGTSFTTIHDFGSGDFLRTRLTLGQDGNLYGATQTGIFTTKTDGSDFQTIYNANSLDGYYYDQPLAQGSDGFLYGTTANGGANKAGAIFKIWTDGTEYQKIYDFDNNTTEDVGGGYIVMGVDAIYGTTNFGYANGAGNIFSIQRDGSGYTDFHDFGGLMGSGPYGHLIMGIDSLFYGTTSFGGTKNSGIIFSVDGKGKDFKKLHDFVGVDGAHPRNGLTQASDGTLYGTTFEGGTKDYGTIFKIKSDGNDFQKLYDFYWTSGERPLAPVLIGMDGKLYGTTSESGGSSGGYGTIYSINTDGSNFTKLLDFNTFNGAFPNSPLIQDNNGTLYGTTDNGGTHSVGTIFSISPDGTNFNKLHEFNYVPPAAESRPQGSLLMGKDGNLYGATLGGGSTPGGGGVLYSISTTGNYRRLYEFGSQNPSDPYGPVGSLIQLEDGNLYGVTIAGGANSRGAIFSVHTDGSGFKKIFDYPSAISINENSLIFVKGNFVVTEVTDKNQDVEFNVYPNPTKNSINLNLENFEQGTTVEVTIFNTLGQQMDHLTFEEGSISSIDVSKYPSGNFIITLATAKKVYRNKFVKY